MWIVGGGLFAVAAVVVGTFNIVDVLAHGERSETTEFTGPVEVVDVVNDVGDVRVVARTDGVDVVSVVERIDDGLRSTGVTRTQRDGRVTLAGTCPNVGGTWCSVTYDIHVPPGVGVRVRTADGDVEVRGAVGDVDVRSDGGRIELVEVAASTVDARSDHGSVLVDSAITPSSVVAASEHGDVEVVVPDADGAFRVDASTEHGTATVDVRTDPAADAVIVARSEHGDVEVRYGS
jgi:hypothetical protein